MVTDAVLLRDYAQTRSADAFAELVRRHAGGVYGTCIRITGNVHDAEDVSQECFLELARNAGGAVASVSGWLHAKATSRSFNAVRNLSTRRRHEEHAMNDRPNDTQPGWSDIAEHVDAALEELPDELRTPLVLRYLEGRTQSEIAQELGVSQPTASRRIESGLDELRGRLRKAGVVVSAVVLAALLAENAASAAPTTLVAALGKMAMAGVGEAATAAAPSSAAGSFLGTLLGKIAAGIAAVVLIGVAGVAVHNRVAGSESPRELLEAIEARQKLVDSGECEVSADFLDSHSHATDESKRTWDPLVFRGRSYRYTYASLQYLGSGSGSVLYEARNREALFDDPGKPPRGRGFTFSKARYAGNLWPELLDHLKKAPDLRVAGVEGSSEGRTHILEFTILARKQIETVFPGSHAPTLSDGAHGRVHLLMDKGAAVRKIEFTTMDGKPGESTISSGFQQMPNGAWMPSEVRVLRYRVGDDKPFLDIQMVFRNWSVGKQYPKETFSMDLPVGTGVFDHRTRETAPFYAGRSFPQTNTDDIHEILKYAAASLEPASLMPGSAPRDNSAINRQRWYGQSSPANRTEQLNLHKAALQDIVQIVALHNEGFDRDDFTDLPQDFRISIAPAQEMKLHGRMLEYEADPREDPVIEGTRGLVIDHGEFRATVSPVRDDGTFEQKIAFTAPLTYYYPSRQTVRNEYREWVFRWDTRGGSKHIVADEKKDVQYTLFPGLDEVVGIPLHKGYLLEKKVTSADGSEATVKTQVLGCQNANGRTYVVIQRETASEIDLSRLGPVALRGAAIPPVKRSVLQKMHYDAKLGFPTRSVTFINTTYSPEHKDRRYEVYIFGLRTLPEGVFSNTMVQLFHMNPD